MGLAARAVDATSAVSAREAVLTALGTVPGVVPTRTMPDTPMAGAAWVVWAESRFGAGKLSRPLTHTYEARVVLPAGWFPETVDTADGLLDALCSALNSVGELDSARPVQVMFDNGTSMPGISARVTVALR